MTKTNLSGLTADLGRFASGLDSVPADASAVARSGVIDALGVMLAARNEPVVNAIRTVLAAGRGGGQAGGEASVLLSSTLASPIDAAMINATAAHAFAMDDVAAGGHPSAVLMPALWAVAEASGRTGADLLRAYVVGYELFAELASREPDPMHSNGWHPTGLLGPIAVAGAVANLKRLSPEQCAHAIGIATSMTGGLIVNFGTPTKALHAGRIASAGLLAASLAEQDVTATVDALEHEIGFLRTVSPHQRVDVTTPWLRPDPLRIVSAGLSIKKYPVCYSTHRVVDAAVDLAAQPGFNANEVEHIDVKLGKTQAWMARHHTPMTALEAKYSVEFAVASGLVARAAGFAQLHESFIRSPLLQRLMAATRLTLRDEHSPEDAIFAPSDRVIVQMRNGQVFDSGEVAYARGHARLPLRPSELEAKFLQCLEDVGIAGGHALFERLQSLETVTDLRGLARL
jgi:aconitate decarboxylase